MADLRHLALVGLASLAALAGCGDDDADYEPEIPWIELGSPAGGIPECAPGWRVVTTPGGATVCDPWPESGRLECPFGSAHFPGESDCSPIGRACPAGDFPDDLPTDVPLRFVLAGATGDGSSPESPMGSIQAALNDLEPGLMVVIGRGTYEFVEVALREGVILQGACAEATVIQSGRMDTMIGAISVIDGSSEVRDLRVEASERPAIMVRWSASVHLSGVVVTNTRGTGIFAFGGGTLTADGLIVEDTRAWDEDQTGVGVWAAEASNVTLRRAIVSRNTGLSVLAADPGTRIVVEDSVVTGTEAGLAADAGGTVEANRVVVDGNPLVGAFASGTGSALLLNDSVVRDNAGDPAAGNVARGIEANTGASCTLFRTLVSGHHGAGVRAVDPGTMIRVDSSVVRDVQLDESRGFGGVGVAALDGATLEVEGSVLEQNWEIGASATGPGTVLRFLDVAVRDTTGAGTAVSSGRGLVANDGAVVEGSRTLFTRNRDVSVYAADPGTSIRLEHSIVSDALPRVCGETTCADAAGGVGVGSYSESAVRLMRFLVAGSALCGVQLAQGGVIDLQLGEIAEHPIGACIQDAGYDVAHLTDGVRYRDNGTNLDTTSLPVPDASNPWGE